MLPGIAHSSSGRCLARPPSSWSRSGVRRASVSSEEVQHLLSKYEAAYSAESASELEALFAPGLTRQNGAHAAENREEALATYRKQFSELQHPTYSL
jgi:hypothetical protein